MRLQVFVQNNGKQISFDNRQGGRRDMILRNATIFWRLKNIKKNYNDTITDDTGVRKLDILPEGYYSFEDLQKKFKSNNITMDLNSYDNTCSITSTGNSVKLGNLGVNVRICQRLYIYTKCRKWWDFSCGCTSQS